MALSKISKGIVAGTLGLALLLGGGTFALWYDSEPVAGGDVQSGQLNFEVGAQTWAANGVAVADINAYRIVPGDVLTLTSPLTIQAEGTNLQATLSADTSAITGDPELLAALDTTLVVSGLADTAGTGGAYEVTPADDNATVSAALTITFPATTDGAAPAADRSNWWAQTAQLDAVQLSTITFDLAQHL